MTVTVTNTGDVDGAEVVQVYVRDVESSVNRPVRELKGFAKLSLAPGESQQVSVSLDQRAFSFWSARLRRWAVEAGEFRIEVGPHSRDLPLTQTVTIDAPPLAGPLDRDSTLQEWMDDPVGRELIERELAGTEQAAVLDEHIEMVGNMPMSALANFGMSLDHDTLDRVANAWRQHANVS